MTEPTMAVDSRELILDAAERIITQRGYSGLSMRELARESGLAKGTIYHHFRDKRDVCLRMIERVMDASRARVTAAAEGPGGYRQRLQALIETYFDLIRDRRPVILATLRELSEEDREARSLFREHSRGLIEPIAGIITEGMAAGEFRRVDPELSALSLLGMMNGFVAHRLLVDETEIEARTIEHTLELFLCGLLRRE